MAPVFYRLERVEEVVGVPPSSTVAARRRDRRRADLVDRLRAQRRPAAAAAAALRLLRGRGRLDPARHRGCRSAASASVAITPESATSVVLTKVLLPSAEHVPLGEHGRGEAADRRRGAEERLRGSDAALRPRPALARADGAADGVRGLRGAGARSRTSSPSSSTRSSRRCGWRGRSQSGSRTRRATATATRPASSPATSRSFATRFGPRERAGFYTFLEMARDVGELDQRAGAAVRPERGARVSASVAAVVRRVARCWRRRSKASGSLTRTPSRCSARATSSRSAASRTSCATARSTRTGSRSSSTGTSTTRTSASPTATSAPSTAARATCARATCCRSR